MHIAQTVYSNFVFNREQKPIEVLLYLGSWVGFQSFLASSHSLIQCSSLNAKTFCFSLIRMTPTWWFFFARKPGMTLSIIVQKVDFGQTLFSTLLHEYPSKIFSSRYVHSWVITLNFLTEKTLSVVNSPFNINVVIQARSKRAASRA